MGEKEIEELPYVGPFMYKPDATDAKNVVLELPDMEW